MAAARLLGRALYCGQFGNDDAGNFVERGKYFIYSTNDRNESSWCGHAIFNKT